MIQDISPFHLNNEFVQQRAKGPDKRSLLLVREENGLWCRVRDGVLELPEANPPGTGLQEKSPAEGTGLRYLIAVDEVRFYMPEAEEGTEERKELCRKLSEQGFAPVFSRELRYTGPAWLRFGALTAWQAAGWYRNNRFCGCCGSRMEHSGKERALVCPHCRNTIYPKLCPVVITGVTDGDRILLTRYAGRDRYARFALVAGFAEIGETIEQTVAREVMEETGLRVKNLRYYKSQPWAYSESLLFGFFCDLEGSDAVTVDENELSTAVWTARKDVPEYGDEISLTYEMMRVFKEGKEPR